MDTIIVALVDGIVVPVTGTIPFLVSSGILLGLFAALWAAFGLALVRDRAALDRAWLRLRRWPIVVQAVVWLLFLPVPAGLWIWRRGWPAIGRLTLIAGLAGWNLLMFVPRPA
ncbi:MAG TPA: hypothetical protein VF763_04855 [Candidatus Limnocylindrales bacterium]